MSTTITNPQIVRRESHNGDEVASISFKAGHRTYFFDIRSTRDGDYYLTISESRRSLEGDGGYIRSKLFLYKEDFDRFEDALRSAIGFIRSEKHCGRSF